MRVSNERRVLLSVMHGQALPCQLTADEWSAAVRAAVGGGIGQALLAAFGSQMPDEQREWLRGDVLMATARHLKTRADLATIGPVLDGAGVPWAVVKGPVLAEHWYAEHGSRSYGDLDLLVLGRGLRDVLDALQGAGCRLLDTNWSLSLRQRRAELTVMLPHGTPLDLHWHLLNNPEHRAQFLLDIHQVLGRRQVVDVAGQACPTLDRVDTLLHLCLHTILSGGRRLAWYVDLSEVLRGFDDWTELVARSQAARADLLVAVALDRVRRLTGATVPDPVLRRLVAHGRAWFGAVRGLDALRPLGDPRVDRLTGQLVVRSTQRGTGGSLAAAFRTVRRDLWTPLFHEPRHPWLSRTLAAPKTQSPLWSGAADPADMQRYFQLAQVG